MTTALVTGGGRGIGRAAVLALATAGFDVAVVSLEDESSVEPDLARIRALGRRVRYDRQDIADVERHSALIDAVTRDLGAIDCLVNNAGVTSLRRDDLLAATPDSFDRCMAVNLRGTFFLTQAIARAMMASAGAAHAYRSIITVTSVNAEVVGENRADYCISKAGLSMASKLFAARLAAEGIHVFEVRPGIIRTDMTAPAAERYDRYIGADGVPLRRWGEPRDVGVTIATIAQGLLPFATGEVVNVGGGVHLHRI